MNHILFSVIIPVYNRESCIHLAIDSIIAQGYKNWELILVDDGSSDRTDVICREYAKRESRIRYFWQENRGVSAARNAGIQNAQGEYIIFLDSDDALEEHCLSTLYNQMIGQAKSPDLICFGVGKNWKPTEGTKAEFVSAEQIRKCYLPTHINIYPQNKYFLLNYVWNKCYKADFIRDNGISFDGNRKTWEDGLFVVNCLDKAAGLLLIPDSLHAGCIHPTATHLSAEFFPNQISNYIQDEASFKVRFEKEFDFTSDYYCHSNLNTLQTLFTAAFHAYGAKAKPLIEDAVKTAMTQHWVSHITPMNKFERCLRSCVITKRYRLIYWFYVGRSIRKCLSGKTAMYKSITRHGS